MHIKKKSNVWILTLAVFILILVIILVECAVLPVSAANGGSCGADMEWSLSRGVLEIKGSGKMTDFTDGTFAPWYAQRDEIRSVKIGNGITSVGRYAFLNCEKLSSITLPLTLEEIGSYAFSGCSRIDGLVIPEGVKYIRENAFSECTSLFYVSLPKTLERIDAKAFYRCYSLSGVIIPQSVKTMGASIFAYCEGLVRAEIRAQITSLPMWTFYGCTSLVEVALPETITSIGELSFLRCVRLKTVSYPGPIENYEAIANGISRDISDFSVSSMSATNSGGTINGSISVVEKENQVYTETTDYVQNDNATIVITETKKLEESGDGTPTLKIDASIPNDAGWNEVIGAINEEIDTRIGLDTVNVTIRTGNMIDIPEKLFPELAGKNVRLTIIGGEHTVTVDCRDIAASDASKKLDLSFNVSSNGAPTKIQKETIGDAESYLLSFNADNSFNFSPNVFLDKSASGKYATLYQLVPGKGLVELQTVLVDSNGYASFYLASVKKSTEYVIALNVSGVDINNAILPEDIALQNAIDRIEKIEYTVSGVRTIMGMTLGWFSLAVVGTLVLIGLIVAIIMYTFFRRKTGTVRLKRGDKK